MAKARVKTKILMQSRRRQKPIFESRSVYTQRVSILKMCLIYKAIFYKKELLNNKQKIK